MSTPSTVPAPAQAGAQDPAQTQPGTGGEPPAGGQPQGAPTPPDPDSPEGMQERLRRRQAVVDQQAEELRRWRALGADPTAVQALLAAQPAPPAGGEQPPVDVDAIRAQIRDEVAAELRTAADRRVVEADVVAALTGRVGISPATALALIPRDQLDAIGLADNGHADPLEVEVAVRALLEKEPGLATQQGPRFTAPADQGPRGGGAPKTLDERIAEAKAAGNMRLAIALETSKLTQQA